MKDSNDGTTFHLPRLYWYSMSSSSFPLRDFLSLIHFFWQVVSCSGNKWQLTCMMLLDGVVRHYDFLSDWLVSLDVGSGIGAYARAARRRVHLATILLRPPSGDRPGRRQDRHAHIPQIGLQLTQPWSLWTSLGHVSATRIPTRKIPIGGILRRELSHMPMEAWLALTNYAGDLSQPSFPEYQVNIVMPSVDKDSAKRRSNKEVHSPC